MNDDRLQTRVIPAVMRVIDRGDFTGSVMRKVARESRMSLNTLYAVVPSKAALILAVAIHCQTLAFHEVLPQVTPQTPPSEIHRLSMHASFDQFTRNRGLTNAVVATEFDEVGPDWAHRIATEGGLLSAPGLDTPFDRGAEHWRGGRLQVLTIGFLGTVLAYSKMLLTLDEAHACLDHLVDAAYLL